MKKWYSLLLAVMLIIGALAGCAGKQDQGKEEKKAGVVKSSEQAAFPVTIKDALGDKVVIDKKPERIVSLIPSNTEIAFALGLGKEVVGVSDYDNYPAEVSKKVKVGGQEINVEKIISLKPNLVLAHESAASIEKAALQQLRDAGIKVFVVKNADHFEQVYNTIDTIGKATGEAEKAGEIIKGMKDKLAVIQAKAKEVKGEKKVLVEVSPAPEIYTAGKNTFMDEMLSMIKADNIAHDQNGWVKIDEEAMVKRNPDVIVTTYGYYVKNPAAKVLNQKGWENVNAVKNKQVLDVNADKVNRPGPRIVEGVEDLAKAIYPEVFK
ncbi:ABC transporter substrate-binding protein [Neobacillus niacini]|uniref:ABC transporter substrate-binding protein n=1 Tax=Neobacillus niacini TaxID=86668 RepID=UPI0028634819|nr:ABC transporter substrate-binding protein [Neobacillus niacini]MDR7001829.1 iron complex transport system substrate-binding protein [Neobacillus niacini]